MRQPGQPARAGGRDRRHRIGEHQLADRRHSSASCEANSRYYVLGYYPPTHPRDGRFHKIEVRVNRPGLRVAARRGYASPRGTDRRRAQARRRSPARARSETAERRQDLEPSCATCWGARCSRAASTSPFRRRRSRTPQKEASVALAIELDGNRLPVRPPNDKGPRRQQNRAVVLRPQRSGQGAWPAHGRSSISRCGPRRAIASTRTAFASTRASICHRAAISCASARAKRSAG